MKITIVLGPFQPLPPEGFGAVEKVWDEFAAEFARTGHEVVLVGKGVGNRDVRGHSTGVRTVLLRGFSATPRLWQNLVKDFLYAVQVIFRVEHSDVIVTNSFWAPVLLPLLARRRGRVIVHVARFPKGQMPLYGGASALQAISSAVAHEIERQCPAAKGRVHVLPYPVDLQVYRPPVVPRSYEGELTVLYVGRVHPEKGLDLLVAAFRELLPRVPRACLRIVGPSESEQGGGGAGYLDGLRSACAGMPVDFVGPLREPAQLAREYQGAHCFCYPSVAEEGEAFGLAVLEAMATESPTVVSRLECFSDFLGDGTEGVVFDHRGPAPVGALADALCTVLLEPRKAAVLGARARTRAEQYSVARVADAYIKLFERVASQRG